MIRALRSCPPCAFALLRAFAFIAIVLSAAAPHSAEPRTIIHAGRLIDGQADQPRSEMSLVIEGGRIASIQSGYLKPGEGDKLISLRQHTVLPGLMDMHTHLQSQHS